MQTTAELTLGYIPYLNCVPFFARLKDNGFQGDFVAGVPSALNAMLQEGRLDASPSSSFEYACNWRDYLLLPGHAIASVGPVKSVLLFSPADPSELAGQKVFITGESATSINLLRIIFREFYGLHDVTDAVPDEAIEGLIERQQPALLIGDRALRLANNLPEGMQIFDLGELWHQQTGLPFVFALWMIRREAVGRYHDEFVKLGAQLLLSREQVLSQPHRFASGVAESSGLTVGQISDYWQTIDYRLETEHLEGLQLFFRLCKKYHLLDEEPELNFFI